MNWRGRAETPAAMTRKLVTSGASTFFDPELATFARLRGALRNRRSRCSRRSRARLGHWAGLRYVITPGLAEGFAVPWSFCPAQTVVSYLDMVMKQHP